MSETEASTEVQVDNTDDLDTFSDDFFGQKSKEASQTKEEVAQGDGSTTDDKSGEAQIDDPGEDLEAELPEEEPPKKKTVQDRINELVKDREDVKRQAKADLDALRKEFEDQLKAIKPQSQVSQEKVEPTPDDVDKDGNPVYRLGEFDPQYIRDLTRFTLDTERAKAQIQTEQERQRDESNRAAQELQTSWNTKLEVAKQEYPDLVEKGQELLNGFNDLPQDYAGYLSTVLMSMDKGPDVFNYLANNPDEARQIVNSGAQKATLALGRIEAKFLEADAQKTLAKPKVSKAPEPPAVRARGTNGAFVSVAPDTDNQDDFEAMFFAKKK